jgi:NAD(P)-dependent dehydrogenase (short-subunit alcohol dehydrogenase family)
MNTTTTDLSGITTIVVGASRGLGRGIATALAAVGSSVIGVSRTVTADGEPAITHVGADATDMTTPGRLLDRYDPDAVVPVAGRDPAIRPLQEQTWETFSLNWETDVRIAFHWAREALRRPLRPGSRVIVISSGAALQGSPLTGGYAGAKATQRFITQYAHDEAGAPGSGSRSPPFSPASARTPISAGPPSRHTPHGVTRPSRSTWRRSASRSHPRAPAPRSSSSSATTRPRSLPPTC